MFEKKLQVKYVSQDYAHSKINNLNSLKHEVTYVMLFHAYVFIYLYFFCQALLLVLLPSCLMELW